MTCSPQFTSLPHTSVACFIPDANYHYFADNRKNENRENSQSPTQDDNGEDTGIGGSPQLNRKQF